jgi:hypothetical protein
MEEPNLEVAICDLKSTPDERTAHSTVFEGLTTNVLNERLRKLVDYGILERCATPQSHYASNTSLWRASITDKFEASYSRVILLPREFLSRSGDAETIPVSIFKEKCTGSHARSRACLNLHISLTPESRAVSGCNIRIRAGLVERFRLKRLPPGRQQFLSCFVIGGLCYGRKLCMPARGARFLLSQGIAGEENANENCK